MCFFCHSFDAKRPGVVLARTHCDAEPVEFQLLRNSAFLPPDSLPVLAPPGLSIDRQTYLYEKIRPFCADEAKDITCPVPRVTAQKSTINEFSFTSSPQCADQPQELIQQQTDPSMISFVFLWSILSTLKFHIGPLSRISAFDVLAARGTSRLVHARSISGLLNLSMTMS